MVDVGAEGQAGQVSEACGVAGDVDAAAADGILRGGAVATVRPARRSGGWSGAGVWHIRRTIEHGRMVASLASEAAALKSSLRY